MSAPVDLRGVNPEPGDRAVYAATGKHGLRAIVEVLNVKKRVLVKLVTIDRPYYGDREIWVDASSLVLVSAFKLEDQR